MIGRTIALISMSMLVVYALVAVVALVFGSAHAKPTFAETVRFCWLATTGRLKPWRGVADPILTASRYAAAGLTPADVAAWRTVLSGQTMDVETKKVATLVKAGWDTSDLRALGPKWFNITYLETAVRAGLTVQDLTALSQTPDRLQPSQVSTVCEVASSRAEAMNWLASLDALAASRRTLAHSLFGHSLKVEIWRWRDALGPDASWYAAAGLALNEAVSLNVEPDGLDTVKAMAALRYPPVTI